MTFNWPHISSLSNSVTVLIPNNDALKMDIGFNPIAQAMAQAKEQLHMVMEAQNRETKQWLWMEEDWESQRTEGSMVVVSDKEVAVEAVEKVVGEIGLQYCNVSFLLDFFSIFRF